MAAIFSLVVSIGGELLPTSGAGEVVQCLARGIHQVQMGTPPFLAASLRAEDLFLPFRNLLDMGTTLLA